MRGTVGVTEVFKAELDLHQCSALSSFLFAMVMDRLTDEIRQESPWTMMAANDTAIYSETRQQVEENLIEIWRNALEKRDIEFRWGKTEYMCVNEGVDRGEVRMQDLEVTIVEELKYRG
ncbi:uncharacterized protein LOC119575547 [Penaeus monodon]|uniref:uncharacterized protein LOC119575547 n=1 Tax=Penaeus monodon TaxID=6687 RepID=UPI0018A7D2F5|nr:uncharacterized protein LOC119575547 [Penaeus monodon]